MNKIDTFGSWTLSTSQPVKFKIEIVNSLFDPKNKTIMSFGSKGEDARRLIIIDLKVSEIYLKQIARYFDSNGIDYNVVVINATEENKDIDNLIFLLNEMEKFGLLRRKEPVIAIGGGVLLDIVGLASNLYRRGVPYIKVPTTLLGLVDASVGAKTGINFMDRRNRLGSYYAPIAAYLDKTFLKTLEPIEISSGLGEIFKMAVVKDSELFSLLEENGEELYRTKFSNSKHSDEVINLAVKGMKDELQENLWEMNLERYVDFGHSFSPVIEMRSLSDDNVLSLTHGQAVALDVIYSSIISMNRNMLSEDDVVRIIKTAKSMNLPITHPFFLEISLVIESLNETIKHRNGNQNLPIPKDIGMSIFVNDLSHDEIGNACAKMKELTSQIS
tara:strand:+ start:2610 stop:3770 length:1161 start_codon:yes stop_codon:yes gene_type:complete